jgi:hypothetical protein
MVITDKILAPVGRVKRSSNAMGFGGRWQRSRGLGRSDEQLLPVIHSNLLSNYPDAAASELLNFAGRITVDARERNQTGAIMP